MENTIFVNQGTVTIGTQETESGYRVFSRLDLTGGKMAGKHMTHYSKNYKTLRGAEKEAVKWVDFQNGK